MPRRPRITLPGVPLHIIQRGNNRQACFYAEQDYQFYLEWLEKYAEESGCAIHAYVLMTNHVHLFLTPEREGPGGQCMKKLVNVMHNMSIGNAGEVVPFGMVGIAHVWPMKMERSAGIENDMHLSPTPFRHK